MKHCNKIVCDILTERAASIFRITTGLKLVLIISKRASVGYRTIKKEVTYDEMAFRVL